MKKKFLAILLCVSATFGLALGLTACRKPESGTSAKQEQTMNGGQESEEEKPEEENPQHVHSLTYYKENENTCATNGNIAYWHCLNCSKYYSDEEAQNEISFSDIILLAKAHTYAVDEAVAATCTQTGLTAGIHCSVCNTVLVAQKVVPAKGHTSAIDAAVAPTCAETGLTAGSHCSVCNTVLTAQETVSATGQHTPVTDAAVAAPARRRV